MAQKSVQPFNKRQEFIGDIVIRFMSKINTWVYKISGGKLGAKFLANAPVMLITTIGRKSGEPRTTPVLYAHEGENVLVAASKGGFKDNPLWYYNLMANPQVEIQIGREVRKMIARQAGSEEKAVLWPKMVAMYADFAEYQARTERDIPLIILSPRS